MELVGSLTNTWVGYLSLFIFIVSYYFIAREENYHMNKAKPALLAGTSIFIIIGFYFVLNGLDTNILHEETRNLLVEISEIFFFLLVAMTYIEVMRDRGVFDELKKRLILSGYTYKKIFWIIGFLAFFISPVADNLTTALVLSAVAFSLSKDAKILVPLAIIIVVGANSGGSWSPFGDITTLMAWTSGKAEIFEFFSLFPSAFIGFLVTAFFLSLNIPNIKISSTKKMLSIGMKSGGKRVIFLGLFTIFISIVIQHYFNIPAMWGMMFGLSLLHLTSYHTKNTDKKIGFDVYKNLKKTEMDTLLFFFGILSIIGALEFIGYLDYIANFYEYFGVINSSIIIGFLSSIVDNIPVMSAVLKSPIDIDTTGWLLLTLCVGIGGSLISFGSAAGIGVMSKMRGFYTFGAHMKYFPIIFLGYIVSIGVFYLQFYVFKLF